MGKYVIYGNSRDHCIHEVTVICENEFNAGDQQLNWCETEAINHDFYIYSSDYDNNRHSGFLSITIMFSDQADAALFKLFWG